MLRCRPRPTVSQWFAGETDPFTLRRSLPRPTSILWDGATTWVLLEGHPADVSEQAGVAALAEVEGPPPLPSGGRLSVRPSELRSLTGTFVSAYATDDVVWLGVSLIQGLAFQAWRGSAAESGARDRG